MNIFLTSYDHKEAALHLDDLRLNKMILETAQLLSSGYRRLFGPHDLLYRETHVNHPCTMWVRKDLANYSWLVDYFDALANEKRERDRARILDKSHRFWLNPAERQKKLPCLEPSACSAKTHRAHKIFELNLKESIRMHKSWVCLFEVFALKKGKYDTPIFDFNCTEFKDESDVRAAYQKQLVKKWQSDLKPPKWTGRNPPYFFLRP